MVKRTTFPRVFWIANLIEVLERFAYYGIYLGFGIYMKSLAFSEARLGIIQTIFLFVSYMVPVISGTMADRYGFKKVLIVSYLAYLPSILLLMISRSFSGIALTMLSIGLAAGIFKPLISGTVRVTTDSSNKTLGFGIFYAMVNVGASFGPVIMGRLRAISWNYAFLAGAVSITVMLIITVLFYKEPTRQLERTTMSQKLKEIKLVLSDLKFLMLLIFIGVFFWIPLWAFFNLLALYVDRNLDTARLYLDVQMVLGTTVANFISQVDNQGTRRLLGESIAHTGYIIMLFQVLVSKIAERFKPIPTFSVGLLIGALGFVFLGYAHVSVVTLVFLGILLFAVGEMTASPRIQEYITWLAPKEKAGLYMGTNFLAIGIGAFSGIIYTPLYGYFNSRGKPELVWYILAAHVVLGILVINLFVRRVGELQEMTE